VVDTNLNMSVQNTTTTTTKIKSYPVKWVWLHGSNYDIIFYRKPYFDTTKCVFGIEF